MHRNCKTLYIAANIHGAEASGARLRFGIGILGAAVSILTLSGCGSGGIGSRTGEDLGAAGLPSTSSAVVPSSTPATTPATTASTASTTTTAVVTTAATGPQTCSDLSADTMKLPGVAAGTSYWDVVVTNLGQAACLLPPQPQFAVLGPNKKQLPVKISGDESGQQFRLEAGASATMVVGYGTDGNPPCDAAPAYLRISPPGLDLAFGSGAKHCANDAVISEDWVAGKHADPH